jgi:hypothetical protein
MSGVIAKWKLVLFAGVLVLAVVLGGWYVNRSGGAAPAWEQGLVTLPLDEGLKGAPEYQVEAELDPEQGRLTGRERVRWTNTTQQPLPVIYLRTYGEEAKYGGVAITDLKVNGRPLPVELNRSLVRVPLASPLAPGESVTLEFAFAATLPERNDPVTFEGMLSSNETSIRADYGVQRPHGIVTLLDAFPRVLRHGTEGSDRPAIPPQGLIRETRVTALYDVWLTAPTEWTVVSSGSEVVAESLADGRIRRRLVAAPTDLFSLIAGKDLQQTTRNTAAGMVRSHYPAEAAAIGQDMADQAAAVLNLYVDRFGPLLDQEIDVVAIPAGQFSGIHMGGGLIGIARGYYEDQPFVLRPDWETEPALAPLAVADVKATRTPLLYHELAHGYWAGVVRGDNLTVPWMIEGMSEATAYYALEQLYGAAAAEALRTRLVRTFHVRDAVYMPTAADGPLRQPLEAFESRVSANAVLYTKGPLFTDGLRRQVGDEAFVKGVRNVLTQYRHQVVPDDEPMKSILAAAGNPPELERYVQRWMDGAHLREDLGPLPEAALKVLRSR